ncbi:RHS repeat domain-containing protein [Ostreibacterium oceani]|uniref:RHS repeat-associated protein n=1 Tax=Ostreibacterium oceani TaxID=2654998 RepID=A0A6N7EZA4_9GAMM|nr:RHS repeat-associated core domain-containing protein [Ostreibacterium oceani]MPV86497.1 hypothetical protein [Ostreibacterium oceani]
MFRYLTFILLLLTLVGQQVGAVAASANTLSHQISYDGSVNRLLWVGRNQNNQDYTFTYDDYGNVIDDGIAQYTYLADNTLVQVSSGALRSYDTNNHRVEKDGRAFVYDANQRLVGVYDSLTGSRVKEYVYLGEQAVARLGDASLPITYLHHDTLGTPVAASDALGMTLWQEERRAYGTINTAASTPRDNSVFTLGYTGHQEDIEGNLIYAKARYYHPVIGRFYAPDPIAFRASDLTSFNRYAYGANNPYKYTDPTGMVGMSNAALYGPSGDNNDWRPAIQLLVFDYTACSSVSWGCAGEVAMIFPVAKVFKVGKIVENIADASDAAADATKVAAKSADEVGDAGKKRGPKTDPNAPHNKKIREIGDQIEADGGTVIAGGGRFPEQLVKTPNGNKGGRRPDVLYQDCKGNLCGVNVGKTKVDGSPIKREQEALDDLNGAGLPTKFERYD